MSVRAALGGRQRVVRLLLTESLVLTSTACAIGLVLARWLVQGVVAMAPDTLVRGAPISIDWRIVAVSLSLSFASAMLCGLAPALIATGRAVVPAFARMCECPRALADFALALSALRWPSP